MKLLLPITTALLSGLLAPGVLAQGEGQAILLPQLQSNDPRRARAEPSGNAEVDAAVRAGIAWLNTNQRQDGSWDQDVAATAAAALAYNSIGTSIRHLEHRKELRAAVKWLRSQAQPEAEPNAGVVGETLDGLAHPLAILAFGETGDQSDSVLVRIHAARGWNPPGPRDRERTIVELALRSLSSSSRAWGGDDRLVPAPEDFARLQELQRPDGDFELGAPAATARRDEAHLDRFPLEHGELATASGLVATIFMHPEGGQDRARLLTSAQWVANRPPSWNVEAGTIDEIYWLLGGLGIHQLGGDAWLEWRRRCLAAILPHQQTEGEHAGSWDPVGAWGSVHGRAFETALMVLVLRTPQLYAPFVE